MSDIEIKTRWVGGPPYREKEKPPPPPPKPKVEVQKVVVNDWPAIVEVRIGQTVIKLQVSTIGVTTVYRDGRRLVLMP